jgi:hypothetical protein
MPRSSKTSPQEYPRIKEPASESGCLDVSKLTPHSRKINRERLKELIESAITKANKKSSREILSVPSDASKKDMERIYIDKGKELFRYFKRYCGDPASTAHQILGRHYREVGSEQFRNRTLQKERMNSGWRYQFLAIGCAEESGRFERISDIGAAEGDFNAVIAFSDKKQEPLSLYVSVKNRSNTMGGQDWPKAILALETVAVNDKNRTGPYCCVFGITMERGSRYIKREQRTGKAHSNNTEIWLSDFFWPFFSNSSYEEIMIAVLEVLMESAKRDKLSIEVEIPDGLLESFGEQCRKAGLVDADGKFNDPHALVRFFCQ